MSFFRQFQGHFQSLWDSSSCLYPGQVGAITALTSHFYRHSIDTPAIFSLPTGYGKTTVFSILPWALRLNKVVVATPRRVLCQQTAERLRDLRIARKAGFIKTTRSPDVVHVDTPELSSTDRQRIQRGDVLVGVPKTLNTLFDEYPNLAYGIDGLFLDEAHHEPADTWKELYQRFSGGGKVVLGTATPYRRDKQHLMGRLAYEYPIAKAREEGRFADFTFRLLDGQQQDFEIARKAIEAWRRDSQKGYDHLLYVRANTINRAKDLAAIYDQVIQGMDPQIDFTLKLLHHQCSLDEQKGILSDLRGHNIDGIIGVDMIGEGVDVPALKIGALHDPYKTLVPAVQLLGRFARQNNPNVGEATIIASKHKFVEAFEESRGQAVTWRDIMDDATQKKVADFLGYQKLLASSEEVIREEGAPPLETIIPHNNVYMYHSQDLTNYGEVPDFILAKRQIVSHATYQEKYFNGVLRGAWFITAHNQNPPWVKGEERLSSLQYNLYIIAYHDEQKILFIHTTSDSEPEVAKLCKHFGKNFDALTTEELGKAYETVELPRFVNIGLRRGDATDTREIYRMKVGPGAGGTIDKGERENFHRGHFFATDEGNYDPESATEIPSDTLGISGKSKVWRSDYTRLRKFMQWAYKVAEATQNPSASPKGPITLLPAEQRITSFPEPVVGVHWNPKIFKTNACMFLPNDQKVYLRDCDIQVVDSKRGKQFICPAIERGKNQSEINLRIQTPQNFRLHCSFSLTRYPQIQVTGRMTEKVKVAPAPQRRDLSVSFVEYLNAHPPSFLLADMGIVIKRTIRYAQKDLPTAELADYMITHHGWWNKYIQPKNENTIHQQMKKALKSRHEIVFYDDAPGELADIVTIDGIADGSNHKIRVGLYHCKATRAKNKTGGRVGDLYTLIGQATKSFYYIHDVKKVLEHLQNREKNVGTAHFVCGKKHLRRLGKWAGFSAPEFHLELIQPALSKEELEKEGGEDLRQLLGNTISMLRRKGTSVSLRISTEQLGQLP